MLLEPVEIAPQIFPREPDIDRHKLDRFTLNLRHELLASIELAIPVQSR